MAIPAATAHLEQGKYGPIYPKSPACYGFTIIAENHFPAASRCFTSTRGTSTALVGQPDILAPLKLHYLRWVLFSN